MKVGLNMSPMHPFEASSARLAVAEDAGADSFWVADHLLGTSHPELWPEMALAAVSPSSDAWLDPFAYIAALGQRSDIPMGVCVTDGIRRRAPDVARTTLTLHQLCRGGFALGVGAGEAENLVPFGYDFTTPVADLEEFLIELRALLDHGVMPQGTSRGIMGLPRSRDDLGAPKVWVAGHGPRMLRLTGKYGDGWIPAWSMSAAEYGAKRAVIADAAQSAGRPMPEAGLHVGVILGKSRDYVAELFENNPLAKLSALTSSAEKWAEHGLTHPGGPRCRGLVDVIYHDLDPEQLRALAPTIPIELVEAYAFMGNADEIAHRVSGYVDNGLEHAVLYNATGIVGGLDEINANAKEFLTLVANLRAF